MTSRRRPESSSFKSGDRRRVLGQTRADAQVEAVALASESLDDLERRATLGPSHHGSSSAQPIPVSVGGPTPGITRCLPADEIIARMASEIVYVELLDEGVQVWRPVTAEVTSFDLSRLAGDRPGGEVLAFPPGSTVKCERRQGDLYAIEEGR